MVKMGPTVLTRIVLLHAVIFSKILIVVGQYDYYSNYDNYTDDGGSEFDDCHFYDDNHEANGNCFHESFLRENEIDDNLKKCCDGHKYIFHDSNCPERGNNGELMCGDPQLAKTDPVNLTHNLTCPQHCKPQLLNQGNCPPQCNEYHTQINAVASSEKQTTFDYPMTAVSTGR